MFEKIPDKISWLQAIIAILGTNVLAAFATAYFTARVSSNELATEKFNTLLEVYIEENALLKLENRELNDLKRDVALLRQQINLLESRTQSLPVAAWLKDLNYVMLTLNDEYERLFLLPKSLNKSNYIGQTDYDIWPEEVAKRFRKHDEWVIKYKQTLKVIESYQDANGVTRQLYVVKYPWSAGGVVVGVGGLAFPLDDITNVPGKPP